MPSLTADGLARNLLSNFTTKFFGCRNFDFVGHFCCQVLWGSVVYNMYNLSDILFFQSTFINISLISFPTVWKCFCSKILLYLLYFTVLFILYTQKKCVWIIKCDLIAIFLMCLSYFELQTF